MKEGDVRIEECGGIKRGRCRIVEFVVNRGLMFASENSVGWNVGVETVVLPGMKRSRRGKNINTAVNTRHCQSVMLSRHFYSNAAAIITSTLAPPAYMPFRLDAAPI